MAMSIGTLLVHLKVKTDKSLQDAPNQIRNTGRAASGLTGILKGMGAAFAALGIAAATRKLAGFVAQSVRVAASAQEIQNRFNVSFGSMANQAEEWATRVSEATGLNDTMFKNFSGTLQDISTSMGLPQEEAFKLSTRLSELAVDLSSFKDIPFEQAFSALRSGIVGETEPLKNLGIVVTDNVIKQTAFAQSILATGRQLTETEKVLARQEAILAGAQTAMGDFTNTSDSFSNQTKILGSNWENLQETFGAFIVNSPAVGQAFGALNNIIISVSTSLTENKGFWEDLVKNAISFVIDGVSRVLQTFGVLSTTFSTVSGGLLDLKLKFQEFVLGMLQSTGTLAQFIPGMEAVDGKLIAFTQSLVNNTQAQIEGNIKLGEAGQKALQWGAQLQLTAEQIRNYQATTELATGSQQSLNAAIDTGTASAEAHKSASEIAKNTLKTWQDQSAQWRAESALAREEVEFFRVATEDTFTQLSETILPDFSVAWTGAGSVVAVENAKMAESFAAFGLRTRQDSQKTLETMKQHFENIKQSGIASAEQIAAAEAQLNEMRRQDAQLTAETKISMEQVAASSASQILGTFGRENKAAAIAKATIDTVLAVQRTWATLGFPLAIPAVAAVIATGVANVAKIRSQPAGFRQGTPGLDFASFGTQTPVNLHGTEAVIPRGGGHQLGGEVAAALGPTMQRLMSSSVDATFQGGPPPQTTGSPEGSGRGPSMVHTTINIEGREFMKAITPALEDATKRGATRVHKAALGNRSEF